MSGRAYGLGAIGLAALLAATPALSPRVQAQDAAQAQQSKDRLSLTVRGKAAQMADEVAIDLTISASAEESGEAEKKYRDKLARVLNALGKGDGKTPADDDAAPKKRKKKKDDEETPAKKKKAAEPEDEDAPKAKKKKAADDDEEAPAKPVKKKKPAIDDDDDEDAPKKKKEEPKKEEPKKDESKKEEPKKDEKKPEEAKADEFPFEVKEGGLSFGVKGGDANQQMRRRMMGQQGGKEEPEFRFSSTLSILFHKVAKADPKALRKRIAEVLDKVSDAGVDTAVSAEGDGSPPVVRFSVGDPEDLKIRAYTEAMGAARKRGTNLAQLADRSLGKVCAVRDQTALPQSSHKQAYNPYQYGYNYQVTAQLGEDWSTEVIMEVDLYVEFELKDKGNEKAPEAPKK